MIYQTGTIKTTAGQTKITGTGTRWKDNLNGISEGCPISYLINNVVYMNTVLSVNSDTEINLTYPVPVAAAAAKYQIATFVLDSMSDGVRKMLANQQYIQYFLRNMDTWLTQDGIVEIKTPTGETVKLESIIALRKLIDGKLSIGAGGWMKDTGYGLPASTAKLSDYRLNSIGYAYAAYQSDTFNKGNHHFLNIFGYSNNQHGVQVAFTTDAKMALRGIIPNSVGEWVPVLMKGDWGIGLTPEAATREAFLSNIDRTDIPSGRHKVGPPTLGTFPESAKNYGAVLYHDVYGIQGTTGRPYVTQFIMYYSDRDDVSFRRSYNPITDKWTDWRQLTRHGDFGFGGVINARNLTDAQQETLIREEPTSIWRNQSSVGASGKYAYQYAPNLLIKASDTFWNMSVSHASGIPLITSGISNALTTNWKSNVLYGTANTTKDTNGNLKAASPIIKVFADHIELNDESDGVTLEKLGTGRYKLSGTLGMNSDASWGGYNGGLVAPLGINGLELLWVDYKVLSDGDIIIETNYRKHSDLPPPVLLKRLITYPEFMDENGDELESYAPVDIPNGHWIDVRVNMPIDSIYNQKLAEAERLAKIEAERVAKEEAEKAAREEAERLDDESKQEQASKLEE